MSPTIFDVIILTIILLSSLLGVYKGMFQVIISSLCFIATILVTIWIYPKVKVIFVSYFDHELIISIVSGIASYIFSLLVFTFIASSLKVMISPLSGGFLDRLLGLFIGFIRGALISTVIFSVAACYASGVTLNSSFKEEVNKLSQKNYPDWLKNSGTTPVLQSFLKGIIEFVPDSLIDNFDVFSKKNIKNKNYIDEIKKIDEELNSSNGAILYDDAKEALNGND